MEGMLMKTIQPTIAQIDPNLAVKGKVDTLRGLKENVIIGKKIPAGTGSDATRESSIEIKSRAEHMREVKAERLRNEEIEEASRMQDVVGLNENSEVEEPLEQEAED